jgi:hypothetical protein
MGRCAGMPSFFVYVSREHIAAKYLAQVAEHGMRFLKSFNEDKEGFRMIQEKWLMEGLEKPVC